MFDWPCSFVAGHRVRQRAESTPDCLTIRDNGCPKLAHHVENAVVHEESSVRQVVPEQELVVYRSGC